MTHLILLEPQLSISGKRLDPAKSAKNANEGTKTFNFFTEDPNEEPENRFPGFRKSSPPKAIQMAKLQRASQSTKNIMKTAQTPKTQKEKTLKEKTRHQETLSKNEILARIGITNPETENVLELSKSHNNDLGIGGGTFVTDKKDIQNTIITNLDKEVQRLRMKLESIDEERIQMERQELERLVHILSH